MTVQPSVLEGDSLASPPQGASQRVPIDELPFDEARLVACGRLFPDEMEEDPWVLFHGTTGESEQSIDARGIEPPSDVAAYEELCDIAAAYRRFCAPRRAGSFIGGLALTAFSIEDYHRGRPVFLATHSGEAASYARPERAGGEVVAGLRSALMALSTVVRDPDGGEAARACSEWMQATRESLVPIIDRLMGAAPHASHSVVYAVRPSEYATLRNTQATEVTANCAISPIELVAKVRIPHDFFQAHPDDALLLDRDRVALRAKRLGILRSMPRA